MNPNESPKLEELKFPGWFAVDFGTSNSTVTLFDPANISIREVLPTEQYQRLCEKLSAWIETTPQGIDPSHWNEFKKSMADSLKIQVSQLSDYLSGQEQNKLLEVLKQIELCIVNSEEFRRVISQELYKIYHEVFRVPTLESQNLIPVILDFTRRISEIPSEIEVTKLDTITINMGHIATQNRRKAIAQGTATNLSEIISRFHHSPKRYFGQERLFKITVNGQSAEISVNQLIQSAWNRLRDLTNDYRERANRQFAEGIFRTAVVTYPTVASPKVRKEIEELFKDLGIPDIQTAYDEAVSVAIFYLWREFGGDLNIGIESFKTRCRQIDKTKWSQNVLVLDIGGGTTDIALINLVLEDTTPSFLKDEDRGAGGRYYRLTPKLLGSSGHLQLGGELITLRVFRLLKVAIADQILTAIQTKKIICDKLEDLIKNSGISDRFLKGDSYQPGSLLKCLDKENPEGDAAAFKEALDGAEKVITTQWKQNPQRLQTFYALWDLAEEAKIKLGKAPNAVFSVSDREITELLNQSGLKFQVNDPSSLTVSLNSHQFERTIRLVIKEAIGITKGLMESRLKSNFESPSDDKVNWLILAGKSCDLYLVKQEINQEFSRSLFFVWNPERVTFDLEFTKLATSAGACLAEKFRRLSFDPEAAKPLLRKGANQIYIDVKNLFYYLPCFFKRQTQTNELLEVFKAGQELYQIAANDTVAKVRSDWEGIQLSNNINRQDYESGSPRLWGNFDGEGLRKRLGLAENEFTQRIKIQWEIDQKLQFNVFLCQGVPHYSISSNIVGLDVRKALGEEIFKEGVLKCDIAVHVIESATVNKLEASNIIFQGGKDYKALMQIFRDQDTKNSARRGLISTPLPPFPYSGEHSFYLRIPNSQEWKLIGKLSRPNLQTDYPCQYRITLDERGILLLQVGEVSYWGGSNQDGLKVAGYVYRAQLQLQPNEVDQNRDPFSGIH